MAYTLGSLFDGSGGFPLAGTLCGIEPKWAAEVEPYPIAVTRSRFPNMKHFGDVSKINGAEIEPVDIITFGSPCQDLSVAGKRAGLKHEANGDDETTRSGLFMEAVRIIKEMREATDGKYPSFALWENVPGAFSSNKGEDFRIVCEELIKIVEPTAVMPSVPSSGWAYADSYVGDGWSLGYRVFDAQYWGVPQRRRRIHLILDLRGERAREVLFEREGLRGYFETGRTPWQGTASDAEGSTGADDREGDRSRLDGVADRVKCLTPWDCQSKRIFDPSGCYPTLQAMDSGGANNTAIILPCLMDAYQHHGWRENTVCGTLTAGQNDTVRGDTPLVCVPTAYSFDSLASNSMKSKNPHSGCRQVEIAKTLDTTDPNPCKNQGGIAVVQPAICLQGNGIDRADTAGCNGKGCTEDVSYTLNTIDRHAVAYAQTYQKVTGTLMANSHPGSYTGQDAFSDMLIAGPEPVCVFDKEVYNSGESCNGGHYISEGGPAPTLRGTGHPPGVCGVDCRNLIESPELYPTLQAKPNGGQSLNFSGVCRIQYIVRRLTPTECARLQGFVDCWGEIDEKDSFTDEELQFWLDVRNTHAEINGRDAKEYTEAQMLTWYNKLHTDSAEYKMWGNGIALPPALYCLQGITDALKEVEDDWML